MGQRKVISIDFESKTISKMKAKGIEGVEFLEMDFLELKYEEGSFDYIVDKGSFDALCCDASPETQQKVQKYLSEISRVLNKEGGKYMCVSLL